MSSVRGQRGYNVDGLNSRMYIVSTNIDNGSYVYNLNVPTRKLNIPKYSANSVKPIQSNKDITKLRKSLHCKEFDHYKFPQLPSNFQLSQQRQSSQQRKLSNKRSTSSLLTHYQANEIPVDQCLNYYFTNNVYGITRPIQRK